jgi:oligoribonuclease NrnB/cAMP/cGMP phosphodiesterase (DHH superfamily)
MRVFYHSDLDGEASAACLLYALPDRDDITVSPINYNIHFPIETIGEDEEVYILDFSLQEEGMWSRLLERTSNVVWIDHHERTIRENEEIAHLRGIRRWEIDGRLVANCELACGYFNLAEDIPHGIFLIGDFDCWRLSRPDESKNFVAGLVTMYDTRPIRGGFVWDTIILDDNRSWIADVCRNGERIIAKKNISNAQDLESFGFEVEIEGLRGLCVNCNHAGSDFFKSRAEGYDVLVPIVFDGAQWTVGLYAPPGGADVDLSEIAFRFGGSGHRGAAGFQCKELPFRIIGRLNG